MEQWQKKSRDGLTICIPNWHHRNYLARSVGSALATARALARQDIECEVLVLDDHSRDGSQRLLLSMAMMDSTGVLHAMLSAENRGLAAMRNQALLSARYRWVCCLDADNELWPENLAFFYRAARDTSAALVYGNLINQSKNGIAGILSSDVIHEGILQQNYIDALAVLDAEQIIQLGGYDSHPYVRTHEDWELVLHLLAENCQIVFVPLILGTYHNLELSMIKQPFDASKMHRMFNQRKVAIPGAVRSRVYHPDLGYLI
jgi:glycosyltransferase involved in cell wall biosynthesis